MVEEGSRNNIILGGGLAGLSAAYHSGIPLYEALAKPGGTAASLDEQGFVFDLGIHVLQSKNVYFLELLDKLGVRLIISLILFKLIHRTCHSFHEYAA